MKQRDITIVTGILDIGREHISGKTIGRRKFKIYLRSLNKIMRMNVAMIIYIQKKYEHIVWKKRKKENTQVILIKSSELKKFPYFKEIQKIQKSKEWVSQVSWLKESPQYQLKYYNPLVMSKLYWLKDASKNNLFNTKYFIWLDGGICHSVSGKFFRKKKSFVNKIENLNKFLLLNFPLPKGNEIHGFELRKCEEYAKSKIRRVARAGIFGGNKKSIEK